MLSPSFWAAVAAGLAVIGGVWRLGRQVGRIEEGVAGIYPRLRRIENWIDRQRH